MLGVWRFLAICDSLEMDLMTLLEVYAEKNQIAYLARRKMDAMPMLAEPFVRCTLHA
jgi:hypothetical protein